MSRRWIERPSPNHGPRRGDVPVEILLVHYTGMPSAEAALHRLCDPAAEVSAHYCIGEDGTIWHLVPEDRRAWHAGVACWRGERDINSRSVGIELVNPGHAFGYRPFPPAQMAAFVELAQAVMARHGIAPTGVLGHSDVAPARKQDPGELFDWRALADLGIGVWPEPGPQDDGPATVAEVQALLVRYGYALAVTGVLDPATRLVLAAFQRHFRPAAVTGEPDAETVRRLRALVRQYGAAGPDAPARN